jgi:hypothetical protein
MLIVWNVINSRGFSFLPLVAVIPRLVNIRIIKEAVVQTPAPLAVLSVLTLAASNAQNVILQKDSTFQEPFAVIVQLLNSPIVLVPVIYVVL